MSQKIIVDTSVWIEYFKGNTEYIELIEAGLNDGSICITGPIVSELLQGVKFEKEYGMLSSCIDAIPFIGFEYTDWMKAGKLSFKLRKKGITIPLTDVLIAVIAERYNAKILTLDKHFKNIQGVKLVQKGDC